ncbi:MAG: MBOAT family protein [Bacteroidales bacterium]|nr:MBOAT family protein [Bacteroidales bacterium]
MVFSSTLFLFGFLALFLVVYHVTPARGKNLVLLIGSLAFYAWGAPKFIFLLLGSLIINYYIVRAMDTAQRHRKWLLALSLVLNLGLLAYFKYANFFVDNLNHFLTVIGTSPVQWTKVALPIGISFFTFQSLTYTIDVYRKVHAPLRRLHDYLLYILMFPQLVAGPIVRFNTIADDIVDRRHNDTIDNKLYGIYRFALGIAKKVLIANVLGAQVDQIYALPHEEVTGTMARLAALAYTFQIYFDFSGYSDMAIGLGYLLGFKFPENFNDPYTSRNVSEFWRRWHMTLGAWFKDYLYIPLGGNRVSPYRMYLNLGIVFAVCGIWHGAGWNFLVWGLWHGLFIISDKLFLNKILSKFPDIVRVVLTFLVVLIGWVFFRIDAIGDAFFYIGKLFDFHHVAAGVSAEFVTVLCISIFFSFFTLTKVGQKVEAWCYAKERPEWQHYVTFAAAIVLILASAAYLSASGFNPFIYFKF